MYRFIQEKDKRSFEVFYKDYTGSSMTGIADQLPLKRKAVSSDSGPSSKQQRLSEVNAHSATSNQLNTDLLSTSKHLNTRQHLSKGD